MAGASLLALLDDITAVLDDVAVLSKIAAKKTAGVLGDDLALNAEQVAGVQAARELPVVWAVFVGSLRNKAILVPAAMLISAFAPWLVTPLLMVGGAYLCFEGSEKLWHMWQTKTGKAHTDPDTQAVRAALLDPAQDLAQLESEKVKGAIRTDFVLSAEIIAITLGVVAQQSLTTQAVVLSAVAIAMTVGVYGLVAGIVKLDDVGLYWQRSTGAVRQRVGAGLLWFAPWLMRALSVVGTAAMFLVGGGIVVHGLPVVHHTVLSLAQQWGAMSWLLELLANATTGLAVGAVLVAVIGLGQQLLGRKHDDKPAH